MQKIIIPTKDVIKQFREDLLAMQSLDYDLLNVVGEAVDIAAVTDNVAQFNTTILPILDDQNFEFIEDREVFRQALVRLIIHLALRFKQCQLYHGTDSPYRFWTVHDDDVCLSMLGA